MKLRITSNSLRLRISQSDLARFMQSGQIEETIHCIHSGNSILPRGIALC